MKRPVCSTRPGARRRGLWTLPLLLLLAAAANAAPQDIDIACAAAPGLFTIDAEVLSGVGLDIGISPDPGTNVKWEFSPPPMGCIAGPSGGPATYTCNGVMITLPGFPAGASVSSAERAMVAGNPNATGAFSFTLRVKTDDADELPACSRQYELVITSPFDLVFVLDRSGSMAGTTNIVMPATDRWNALERAVDSFTPLVESSSCAAKSRFGLSFFSTTVQGNITFPSGLTGVTGSLHTAVHDEMVDQSPPGGFTALGGGLQNGIGKLITPSRKRVVMVFSDGEQNQDPRVNPVNGTEYLTSGSPSGTVAPGGTGLFKVVTVGIGAPMGDYHAALQNLANNNGGSYHVTQTGQDLGAALDMATQDLLEGCSPQLVATHSGVLSGTVTLPAFALNRRVGQLLLKVTYGRDFEPSNLAQLLAGIHIEKDGSDVTPLFQPVLAGSNTVLLKTGFTIPGSGTTVPPEGSYTVRMTASLDLGQGLDYRAVVFADDRRLAMDWRVDPAAPRVNRPFRPTLRLSWLSHPVTGATVEAVILKPGDDLGDLLARDPLTVDPSGAPDAGSPGFQKYLALTKDPAFLAKLLPAEQHLTLSHQGGGVYSAAYDPGDVSGVYQVLYQVSADDPAFGRLQRQAAESVFVRFGEIDLAASVVRTTVGDDVTTIDFRPKTTTGRFLGPAQGGAITVAGAGVTVDSITDHQDGRYTLVLAGDPDAPVKVAVLGDEIYDGPASGFGAGGGYRYALSLHAGRTDPRSGFAAAVGGDLLVELDFEYVLSSRLSLEAVLGRYDFDPDPEIRGGTLYARGYLPWPGFRLFGELGAGFYDPDDLDASWGLSGGLGVDRALAGGFRGEIGIDLFHLFNDGDDREFLAYKLGIRRAF